MKLSHFAAVAVLFLLAACGTYEAQTPTLDVEGADPARAAGAEASYSPFNHSPPQYSGMTAGRIVMSENGTPQVVEFISGKEAENATITFKAADGGEVTYNVNGLRGFVGQLSRSQVETSLAEQLTDMWTNLAPEIRGGIVDAVCATMTGGLCAAL